jgi:hypothetical protein
MAGDCGIELRKYNVADISLMVGAVKTELVSEMRKEDSVANPKSKQASFFYIFSCAPSF